jgi:hypothetical protein
MLGVIEDFVRSSVLSEDFRKQLRLQDCFFVPNRSASRRSSKMSNNVPTPSILRALKAFPANLPLLTV